MVGSIRSLYRVSMAEGEGVGTAYEYFAKAARLRRFMRALGTPRKILVAGLPERYGFSMDFLLMAEAVGADVLAVDERNDRIRDAGMIVSDLSSAGILTRSRIHLRTIPDWTHFAGDVSRECFDLALSCEVLQRLDSSAGAYLSALGRKAKGIALFVPNSGNAAHMKHSGLRSLSLEDLLRSVRQAICGARIHDRGHIDMPPFPPGISRSQEKREHAADSTVEGLLMNALQLYCRLEKFWPGFIKSRVAHIAFVMVEVRESAEVRGGTDREPNL